MENTIDEYFDFCDNRTRKVWVDKTQSEIMIADPASYTMSGLARYLGLSRQALMEYNTKPAFNRLVLEARERIKKDVETRLMEGKNTAGAIFSLKNNFGWKDEQKHDVNIDNPLILVGLGKLSDTTDE